MASVNKVILVGHVGRDPEVRYLPSGAAVANFSLATSSKFKDRAGETQEETQWHRVTFFDRLAEIAGEYVKKGTLVYIEGRLKYGKYTDKDGVEKNTTDITGSSLQLLGGRDQEGGQPRQAPPAAQQPRRAPEPGKPQPQQRRAPPAASTGFEDMDDDIPF